MIYPLTKRERLRVLRCAENYIARIPDPERWAMLDGAHRLGLTTEIEIDLSDPTDVSVIWLGRKVLTVPRQALRRNEPLEDHIVTHGKSDVNPEGPAPLTPAGHSGPGPSTASAHADSALDQRCCRSRRIPSSFWT